MKIIDLIGLIAGIIQAAGYVYYGYYVFKNTINPNTGSWLIWSYGNAIVCINYILLGGNLSFSDSLPVVCSILCVISGILFIFFKKIKKPKTYEVLILFVDITITIYWYVTKENITTFILLQISVFISFVPIIREVLTDPSSERKKPWIIWSIAYGILFLSQITELDLKAIYPLNYMLLHTVIAVIAKKH